MTTEKMNELRYFYGSFAEIAEQLQQITFRYSHVRLQLNGEAVITGEEVANDIYFLRELQEAIKELPEPNS
ncbi:MAG: hypothetical protein M9892_04520 [Bacteroidetes bacterium]|nr:hypothetical protein [Bacteroidota bacterium]